MKEDKPMIMSGIPPFIPESEKLKNSDLYEIAKKWAELMWKSGLEEGRTESPLFVVLPVSILENESLSANAKLLYAEIMALSKKSGTCYATNKHLGEKLGLSLTSIPQLLRELKGCGMIQIDIDRNSEGTYRDITVSYFNNGGHSSQTMRGIVKQQGQKRYKQIEIKKEIKTSESTDSQDIVQIFKLFEEKNPAIKRMYGNITQRKAAERLIKSFGLEKVKGYAKFAIKVLGMPYAPRVTTPYLLETKWADLEAFYHESLGKKEEKSPKVVW